jgi:hypothetical protein
MMSMGERNSKLTSAMIARRYKFCAWLVFLVSVISLLQAVVPKHRIAAADLDRLVQDKRYPELQAQLPVAKLTPAEHNYFSGILADSSNHTADAITARLRDSSGIVTPSKTCFGSVPVESATTVSLLLAQQKGQVN